MAIGWALLGPGRHAERSAPGEPEATSFARSPNDTNLVEALKRVLGGKSMTVAEATKRVLEAG